MPCPYLGTKEDSSLMFSEPNPNNACYAQYSEEKRLFRTVSIGYADVPRKTQQEWCLSEDKYVYCPYYAAKSKGGGEEPASPQAEFIEPVMVDASEEEDGGIRKTAFLAAGLVLAALLVGALLFFLRGQPEKDTPSGDGPSLVTASPTETRLQQDTPSPAEPAPEPQTPKPKPAPEPEPPQERPDPTPIKPKPTEKPRPKPKPTPQTSPTNETGSKDWAAMNKLLSVSLTRKEDERLLSLAMEKPPTEVKPFYLKAHDNFPERFFVDLHGICIPSKYQVSVGGHVAKPASEILVDDERISLLKIAQNQKEPLVARVAVYLKLPAEYEIKQEGSEVRIHLDVD